MNAPRNLGHHLFLNAPAPARCPVTGRAFEDGQGALPRDVQTANFVRDAALAADLPRDGDRCSQTGRRYEIGSGCLPKSIQTQRFLDELPPDKKARRHANFEALKAVEPAGRT